MVLMGFEGSGKTDFYLKNMPTPQLIANLDRPLTKSHLAGLLSIGDIGKARAEAIYYTNLRERMDSIGPMEAGLIKDQLEDLVNQNLDWLRGGTFVIDGGSQWRDVLKLSDPTIGEKLSAGKKFNPKDKGAINAYVAGFLSYVQDRGINVVVTGHAAFSWEMRTNPETGVKALERTKQVYPKLDDIIMERGNLTLLTYLRCTCGRNITSQDGTCDAVNDPTLAREAEKHQGRKFMTRVVKNKFNPGAEGSNWENLDRKTLEVLNDPKKAAALL